MSNDRRDPVGSHRWEACPLVVLCGSQEGGGASAFAANTQDPDHQLAGRFHAATMVRNRPRTLGTWRVTTTSPTTADCVGQLLGGHAHQDPTTGRAEVLTAASTVGILLEGPDALHIGWQRSVNVTCDGATQDDGQHCACPAGLAARRAAAKRGDGCRPRLEVRFVLADAPAAGVFGFASEDWSLVEQASMLREALDGSRMPARARLRLERTLHTLRSGRVLACTRPVITLARADRKPEDPSATAR